MRQGNRREPKARQEGVAIALFLLLAFGLALSFAYRDQLEIFQNGISRGQIFGRDFAVFWTASLLAWQGDFLTIFESDVFRAAMAEVFAQDLAFMPFPYPPHALFVFLPLAWLPYRWSFALWVALGLGFYLLAASTDTRQRRAVLLLLLAPATLLTIILGQNGFLTAVLLVGGMRLIPRHPLAAGVLIGFLTIKPQLGLLLPFALVAGGHWRTFISASLTALALLGASWIAHGPEAWLTYIGQSAAVQARFLEQGQGMFMYMIPSAFMAARLLGLGVIAGYALQATSFIAALCAVIWAFRRKGSGELKMSVLLTATFLASPYVFNYDMTIVTVAVFFLAADGLRRGFLTGERVVLGGAWLLPIGVMYLNAVKLPIAPLVLGALLIFALIRLKLSTRVPEPVRSD